LARLQILLTHLQVSEPNYTSANDPLIDRGSSEALTRAACRINLTRTKYDEASKMSALFSPKVSIFPSIGNAPPQFQLTLQFALQGLLTGPRRLMDGADMATAVTPEEETQLC
jgi:hypothetical protein